MFKKTLTVALVVGAAVGISVPGVASGSWKHHQTAIQQDVQFGLTGNIRFQGGLGGLECQITSRTKLLASTTTAVTETVVPHPTSDTANCKGLGGMAFCQYHNSAPQAPSWTVHSQSFQTTSGTSGGSTHSGAAVVTTQNITVQTTGGFCPTKGVVITGGSVGMLPDGQEQTITNVVLSGTLQTHFETSSGGIDSEHITLSGTLQIENPAQRATYGF